MAKSMLVALFLSARLASAAIGGSCTYNGIKGTCQSTSNCQNAFTVTGACPDDPADVKCCLTEACTSTAGAAGVCLNNPGSACGGTFVKNRCKGLPNDVQCCVGNAAPPTSPAPPAPAPDTELDVTFWIKSFIPLDFEDVTHPWPNHPGKTILNGLPESLEWVPNFGGCFVTDERSFSSDRFASARMHSEAWVMIRDGAFDWKETHRCGLTVKVDCDDGSERDSATASTDAMNWSLTSGSSSKVVLQYAGLAADPLVKGAPKIDIEGTLTVDRANKEVVFTGKVDDFPSFEAYVVVDGRGPYRIAALGPKEGSDATSLFGGANREFSGRVAI